MSQAACRAARQDELESIGTPVIEELDVVKKRRYFLDLVDDDGLYSIRGIELTDEEASLRFVAPPEAAILQVQKEGALSLGQPAQQGCLAGLPRTEEQNDLLFPGRERGESGVQRRGMVRVSAFAIPLERVYSP
jgi:hypothetical protein